MHAAHSNMTHGPSTAGVRPCCCTFTKGTTLVQVTNSNQLANAAGSEITHGRLCAVWLPYRKWIERIEAKQMRAVGLIPLPSG